MDNTTKQSVYEIERDRKKKIICILMVVRSVSIMKSVEYALKSQFWKSEITIGASACCARRMTG
jgi:hypothetical protein